MALSSLTSVKTHLGLSLADTAPDAALNQWLAEVSAAIRLRLRFDPEQPAAPITDFLNGTGTQWLSLPRVPVSSITSLYLDNGAYWGQAGDAFPATSLKVQGRDYALSMDGPAAAYSMSGLVLRINGTWDYNVQQRFGNLSKEIRPGQGNIKVTYLPGFPPGSDALVALELAVNQTIARIRNSRTTGDPVSSESFDGYSYSLRQAVINNELEVGSAAAIIARLRTLNVPL